MLKVGFDTLHVSVAEAEKQGMDVHRAWAWAEGARGKPLISSLPVLFARKQKGNIKRQLAHRALTLIIA
jgi:hypothetical protein